MTQECTTIENNDTRTWFNACLILLLAYLLTLCIRGIDSGTQPDHPTAILFCLIPIALLYLQYQWKFKAVQYNILLFILGIPLLTTISLSTYKLILLIFIGGISSLFSDKYLEFTNPQLYFIDGSFTLFYLNTFAALVVGLIVFYLNLRKPFLITLFRYSLGLILGAFIIIGSIFCFIASFVFVNSVYNFFDAHNNTSELIEKIPFQKHDINVYQTNYGATTSLGIIVREEKQFIYGVKLIKDIYHSEPCFAVKVKVINPQQISISSKESSLSENEEWCRGLPQKYQSKLLIN